MLNGCRSRDPDGDALSFEWLDRAGDLLATDCRVRLGLRRDRIVQLFTLRVSDGGFSDSAQVVVLRLPGRRR